MKRIYRLSPAEREMTRAALDRCDELLRETMAELSEYRGHQESREVARAERAAGRVSA